MGFQKGHKFGVGRKSGGKNNTLLIKYHQKKWDHSFKNSSYKLDEIEHRINNDLPIDDLTYKLTNKYSTRKPSKPYGPRK